MSLSAAEVQKLASVLADQAATAGDPADYLRDLVANRAALPDRWRREVVGRRAENLAVATRSLVRWADAKGINATDPRYTALGSLLEPLLEDVGPDVAADVVALIVLRRLYRAADVLDDLTRRYQVPEPPSQALTPPTGQEDPAETLALQSAARHTPLLLDVDSLATGIRRAASVCRVEIGHPEPAGAPGTAVGTGFVVGERTILTACHVVDEALDRPIRVRLRSTSTVEGVVLAVPAQHVRRRRELDLAFLHTAGPLPRDAAPLSLTAAARPRPGDALAILQHPDGGPLRLALTANGVVSVAPDRQELRYATFTRGGSSGAPCFDASWRVVAVHRAERSTVFGSVREGVLTDRIPLEHP